jgi:hypothetical protein
VGRLLMVQGFSVPGPGCPVWPMVAGTVMVSCMPRAAVAVSGPWRGVEAGGGGLRCRRGAGQQCGPGWPVPAVLASACGPRAQCGSGQAGCDEPGGLAPRAGPSRERGRTGSGPGPPRRAAKR